MMGADIFGLFFHLLGGEMVGGLVAVVLAVDLIDDGVLDADPGEFKAVIFGVLEEVVKWGMGHFVDVEGGLQHIE